MCRCIKTGVIIRNVSYQTASKQVLYTFGERSRVSIVAMCSDLVRRIGIVVNVCYIWSKVAQKTSVGGTIPWYKRRIAMLKTGYKMCNY